MAGKGHPAPSGTGRKLLSKTPLYFYFSLDSGFFFRHTSLVNDALLVQGRQVTESNLQEIRELLAAHPAWSRRRLSEALCEQWNWCNGAGLRKDMAARTLLLKLHQRGLIALPARRQIPTNRMRTRVLAPRVWDQTPYRCTFAELGPVEIQEVSRVASEREELAAALAEFHYLGSGRSEEHTSELQSPVHLVCRLLLEKKKKKRIAIDSLLRAVPAAPRQH